MKETTVIEINTDKDLEIFCKRLKRARKQAPKSLTFTVAITFDRKVEVRRTTDADIPADQVWRSFNAKRRKRKRSR